MELLPVAHKIYSIRNLKVMLDFDLANLYQVETRILKQAVRRNQDRFWEDFIFTLNESEINELVSQNVMPSKSFLGGSKPFALLRSYALSHQEFTKRLLTTLESKYDQQSNDIFDAIKYLIRKDEQDHL